MSARRIETSISISHVPYAQACRSQGSADPIGVSRRVGCSLDPLLCPPPGASKFASGSPPPPPPWGSYKSVRTRTNLYAPAPRNARNHENGSISAPMARQKLSMSEIPIARRAEAIGRGPGPWKEALDPKNGVGGMAKPLNKPSSTFSGFPRKV